VDASGRNNKQKKPSGVRLVKGPEKKPQGYADDDPSRLRINLPYRWLA
jgi:hypothetical protein